MESVPADEDCVPNSQDESDSLTDYTPSISNKVKKSKTIIFVRRYFYQFFPEDSI